MFVSIFLAVSLRCKLSVFRHCQKNRNRVIVTCNSGIYEYMNTWSGMR